MTRELGRLCKWLRILGFDAEYYREETMASLIIQALRENRKVITRRKEVGDLKVVTVHSDHVKEQLREVLDAFGYVPDEKAMFRRCVVCNLELKPAAKAEVKEKVPGYVFDTQEEFYQCLNCGRVYWQGTHWGNVRDFLQDRE